MKQDYYQPGGWNATCSMCGRKRKANELEKNWQGQYRCPEHNEERHPQDFVRGVNEHTAPPWVQSSVDTFVPVCDIVGISAFAGMAVAGCSIAGKIAPSVDVLINNYGA